MSATQEEDKKPGDDGAHIILKVKSQDGDEVLFKIRGNTQLKNLMYAYCDRRGLKIDAFSFFFDMRRLRREQTPDELDMKDGDVIDAFRPMSGGLRANQLQWSYMIFDKIE
ncbi:unnamed protein product [Arabis nemorensis]|uniref:Ubiquitin-like domain-containing protein n=1 Tax=Arabis nemorensis TaxID=586526 RepID=A0A565CR17_9BRAS|nr:unnamed protein product [Arabis nemorensis]